METKICYEGKVIDGFFIKPKNVLIYNNDMVTAIVTNEDDNGNMTVFRRMSTGMETKWFKSIEKMSESAILQDASNLMYNFEE